MASTTTQSGGKEPLSEFGGSKDSIAIIGMSGRFPGANDLEEFWDILERGLDLHKEIPPNRFNIRSHYDRTGRIKNTTLTPYGCFLKEPDLFDRRLFRLSPREAEQTDPMHRLQLMTAYEALEMAGIVSHGALGSESRRVGTFYGQSSDDWRQVNSSQDIDTFHVPGSIRAFGPGRLNYHFGWEGPSMSVDTACSASAVAIQLACSSLRLGECNIALAGGANIMTAPDLFAGLSRGNFLSPTGSCKTWDKEADGYCRADAVGTIVLKRVDDAVRDKDDILAIVRSAITNHSADAVSITHPHSKTQELLFRKVLQDAGIVPGDVDYIEMHGTGTIAGDLAESASVASVFGNSRKGKEPLMLGAVKSNIGHGEAASGITSVIKALMMFRKNLIPKHVGIKTTMNENLATFSMDNIKIPGTNIPFAAVNANDRRRILVNNFNATGGNTSLLIEDFPTSYAHAEDPRQNHVIAISAATLSSFKENIERLRQYLKSKPNLRLPDLSYTTTARRMHHALRFACVVSKTCDLLEQMETGKIANISPRQTHKSHAIIFLFTGQTSQYWGMGRRLFETSELFRENLNSFEATCEELKLPSFLSLIRADNHQTSDPVRSQLALVALEIALALLWISWGLQPAGLIGHSLGEYAALCIAGVMSVKDTLYLVGTRAKLISTRCEAGTHVMMSVNMSSEQLRHIINHNISNPCEIACINGPHSTVVSGPSANISLLQGRLRAKGNRAELLETSYAFHSSQMDAIQDDFQEAIAGVQFSSPRVPIASSLLGQVVSTSGVVDSEYLLRQTRRPVNFLSAIRSCAELLPDQKGAFWLEIGPHPQCLQMARSSIEVQADKLLPSLDQAQDDWATLGDSLVKAFEAGFDIAWKEYHKGFENALNLVQLPSYSFDLQSYWLQYEGNWSVTKNQTISKADSTPLLHSTTVHSLAEETITNESIKLVFASDLSGSDLHTIILGHKVNGLGLCPSSVYADMAMTAADYLCKRVKHTGEAMSMDVANLEVYNPLVVRIDDVNQQVKVVATKNRVSEFIEVSINSSTNGNVESHARCIVRFGKPEVWMSEWTPDIYLYESRIQSLIAAGDQGKAHRILKTMVYKLFSALVHYEESFRGIQEVVLDSEMLEATARVELTPSQSVGNFHFSPYWIDSLAHLSGFVLNGSDTTPNDMVFISHGWQSMRIARPLVGSKTYQTYVRMRPTGDRGLMVGDVRIFDGTEMIGIFQGLRFQRVKKDIMSLMLPSYSKTQNVPHASKAHKLCTPHKSNSVPLVKGSRSILWPLDIVAQELRVEPRELTDEMTLEELGVDSLMTISITAKLQECTQINLSSSLLTSCETIGQLKAVFRAEVTDLEESSPTSQTNSESSAATEEGSLHTTSLNFSKRSVDLVEVFRVILGTELSIDLAKIHAQSDFIDLGVDAISRHSISSTFSAETDCILPPKFWEENSTFAHAEQYFKALKTHLAVDSKPSLQRRSSPDLFCSYSYLQRAKSQRTPILFLLPDGSGSASSYANLRTFSVDCAVIAFNSPFRDIPHEYTGSLEHFTQKFVSDIQKLQPNGPYLIGGWSIGGVYAYEAAVQLEAQALQVKGLILIDSVCPVALPPLPKDTLELLDAVGIFDSIKKRCGRADVLSDVREHFLHSIDALAEYVPKQLSAQGRASLICKSVWARNGIFELLSEEQKGCLYANYAEQISNFNDMQRWLIMSRTDTSSGGWHELLDCDTTSAVVDGDHFSMMRNPAAADLSKAIATALCDILAA